VGAWFFFYPRTPELEPSAAFPAGEGEAFPTQQIPADWKEYRNQAYGFSLRYPSALAVNEITEGGGAMTITFQSIATGQGIQIFIVPYVHQEVSTDRFARDVPSGVFRNPRNVVVCGVGGTSFESQDSILGDTQEVWFIHAGYLFEATTLAPLKDFQEQILSTCSFD